MKKLSDLSEFDTVVLKIVEQLDPYAGAYSGLVEIAELRGMNYVLQCFMNHLWRGAAMSSESIRTYFEGEVARIKLRVSVKSGDIVERMIMAGQAYEQGRLLEDGGEEPEHSIAKLKELPYGQYLMTPHWKDLSYDLKTEVGKCQLCGARDSGLHIHHNTYANLGNENREDLVVLCSGCHDLFHRYRKLERS